jgi:hypothetical protein
MSFEDGIFNLTNWAGNVILPTLSGLFFAIALIRFVGAGTASKVDLGGISFFDGVRNLAWIGNVRIAGSLGQS